MANLGDKVKVRRIREPIKAPAIEPVRVPERETVKIGRR